MEIKQMLAPVIYDGARSGIKRTRDGDIYRYDTHSLVYQNNLSLLIEG